MPIIGVEIIRTTDETEMQNKNQEKTQKKQTETDRNNEKRSYSERVRTR